MPATLVLSRVSIGRVFAFSSAPIANVNVAFVAADWTGLSTTGTVTPSLSGGALRLTVNAGSGNRLAYYNAGTIPAGELFIVARQTAQTTGGAPGIRGAIESVASAANINDACIIGNVARGFAGNVTCAEFSAGVNINSDADAANRNLPITHALDLRAGEARYRCISNGGAIGSNDMLKTITGVVAAGVNFSLEASSSAANAFDYSAVAAMTGPRLIVEGPDEGAWVIRVRNAANAIIATSAAQSGGVAFIDFVDELANLIPSGVPLGITIEIFDGADVIAGPETPDERLWGGDVWSLAPAIEAPTGVTVGAITGATVALSWDAVENAAEYEIRRSTVEGGPYTLVGTSPTPDFTDDTVEGGTIYYYVVVALTEIGEESDDSEEVTAETLEAFAPCTISLEVFEADATTLAWRVTTDPAKANPYLDRPTNYGARELDPVKGAAVISTITLSVRDVAQTPGDQETGFVTERLDTIRGRRCRVYRHPSPLELPVLIADGPASKPRLREDYASFEFEVRDTRETERKLQPFADAGTLSLYPFGPIEAWGELAAVTPIVARCDHTVGGGFVNVTLVKPGGGNFAETLDEYQREAVKAPLKAQLPSSSGGRALCDVLWRLNGSGDPWSQAFPALIIIGSPDIASFNDDGETAAINLAQVLDGFPALLDGLPAHNDVVEFLIRYRGAPTRDLPAYFDGALGDLLTAMYDRTLERPAAVTGDVFDLYALAPLSLSDLPPVRYDAAAFAPLTEAVLLRQTAAIADGRDWAEDFLYAPSGWIPALDRDGQISPVNRQRPEIVTGPEINNTNAEASSAWDAGERIVSVISYRSNRYFLPSDDAVERGTDGVATREVEKRVVDADALNRFGELVENFDATAFATVGEPDGSATVLGGETVDTLVEGPGMEVLARYAGGAPCVQLRVRRSELTAVREGDFVPADLSWLPGAGTTRGLVWDAGHILMIEETDCAWCTLLIERCPVIEAS